VLARSLTQGIAPRPVTSFTHLLYFVCLQNCHQPFYFVLPPTFLFCFVIKKKLKLYIKNIKRKKKIRKKRKEKRKK